jgi:hypothetical protein
MRQRGFAPIMIPSAAAAERFEIPYLELPTRKSRASNRQEIIGPRDLQRLRRSSQAGNEGKK